MSNQKITKREENFSEWYQDVIEASELAEHSNVKGSMVIKPYGYAIWENIQKELDSSFKDIGVENAYFPLFIPENLIKKEASHVEGFSPELAVVTIAGGKPLSENLVVRPTSETIIYDTYSKWISSYRDLPLLINQWANVVRWELRPRIFLRTTEFLWQEGHTVHATMEEADLFSLQILDIYERLAQDFLAIPVIKGQKSESEKFAGAFKTYSIEAIMQDGKALQFATSHNLGQNFSKAFGIKFQDENSNEQFGYQTSWGLSTRSIGGLIMTHSDDLGLVLPPKIAPITVIIIPVLGKEKDLNIKILEKCSEIETILKQTSQLRVKVDTTDRSFGSKNFHWEKKGVPIRIEVGPKDIESNTFNVIRRDTLEKTGITYDDLVSHVLNLSHEIQENLFNRARNRTEKQVVDVFDYEEFKLEINKGNSVYAYWDLDPKIEARIKEETKATSRNLPFKFLKEEGKSILTGKNGRKWLFSKAY
jgi:prolyl-tRNA synthetase